MDELQQLLHPHSATDEALNEAPGQDDGEHITALGLLAALAACVLAWVAVIAFAVWALQAAQGWLW